VTAYFDIGKFQKGRGGGMFTPQLYRKWMTVFAQITNPVVAYFDDVDHAAFMRDLRKKLSRTRIIVVDRKTLWSFCELEPRIAAIFSQENYPFDPPNTVVSKYSAAMHAKYELMRWAVQNNPFRSAYISWLDIGLFRDLATDFVDDSKSFQLGIPPRLNRSAVAYAVVSPRSTFNPTFTAEQIVRSNFAWVCGCFFIARVDVMWRWTTEYLSAVERMVSENWISTDQQVISDIPVT